MANTKRTRRQTPERAPTNAPQAQPAPAQRPTFDRPLEAPPKGKYTEDTYAHLARASAMSMIISGAGFDTFMGWNKDIQSDYLLALRSEVQHAVEAYNAELAEADAERTERAGGAA